jgi:TolB-like protein/DNA-binding winged helix-turn-helix (wHTH) protein/Tfp pilus assembly protein PilF
MKAPDSLALQIGAWRVDPALDEISKDGTAVKLEPRTMSLLVCLAEHAGQVVSVDQLLDEVWKDVVVTPNSVYHAVAALRRVLGDNTKDPTYIANILRRGYRLIAPVAPWVDSHPVAAPDSSTMLGESSPAPQLPATDTRRSRFRRFGLAASVALALALALAYSSVRIFASHKLMLVVLPFENLSGDAGRDYFSDGMTEELITQLGSLDPDRLGVIARTSAMQYKGAHKDVAQIAKELGVNYLLEGSVRGSSERVRVTAQLIVTKDQTHIWAQSFDRETSDILKLQSEVARAIADKIQLTLSAQTTARLAQALSVNPQAHEAYLEGLEAENLRTKPAFERAVAAFNRAIALDPRYALAYAELARTYSLGTVVGLGIPSDTMSKARTAATKALEIDDSIVAAHTTMGFIHAHFDFDWAGAEREFRRAIQLNPSEASAHFFYSNSLLSPLGRHDEAIAEMSIAIRLDPLSAPVDSFLGRTYLWARRYNDALAHLQKSVQRFPNFALAHMRLARLYTYIDRFSDAIAEETKARLLSGQDARDVIKQEDALRSALAARGQRGYWEKELEFSQSGSDAPEAYTSSYGIAILYARLGDNDKALESLEQAYKERHPAMVEIGIEPALDPLRADIRFHGLLSRVGLTQ